MGYILRSFRFCWQPRVCYGSDVKSGHQVRGRWWSICCPKYSSTTTTSSSSCDSCVWSQSQQLWPQLWPLRWLPRRQRKQWPLRCESYKTDPVYRKTTAKSWSSFYPHPWRTIPDSMGKSNIFSFFFLHFFILFFSFIKNNYTYLVYMILRTVDITRI